jgi:hypothetical protein
MVSNANSERKPRMGWLSHDTQGRTVTLCAENDLAGMEGRIGVPGAVGGALRMNAGARGTQIGSHIGEVKLYPLLTVSGGGTVSRANTRAQTANGLAWPDIDHSRRSEGKFSLRQDISPLARLRGQLAIFADPAPRKLRQLLRSTARATRRFLCAGWRRGSDERARSSRARCRMLRASNAKVESSAGSPWLLVWKFLQ